MIEDVYNFEKYNPNVYPGLKAWSWIQLIVANLLLYFMLAHIDRLDGFGIIIFTLFLAATIFSYTSLMDHHPVAMIAEVMKLALGISIYVQYAWFEIDTIIPGGQYLILTYIFISFVLTIYFLFTTTEERKLLKNMITENSLDR